MTKYKFKQPFLTVHLVNWLQDKVFYIFGYKGTKIHNFIGRLRSHRCSVIVNGEYIFEPEEAIKYYPNLVESYD